MRRWDLGFSTDAPLPTHDRLRLLERLADATASRDVTVLAFGLGPDALRLVLDGETTAMERAVHALRVGTSRSLSAADHPFSWAGRRHRALERGELTEAIAWTHAVDPDTPGLANPWTSHRDLLGYRKAAFFDPAPTARLVRPHEVHARVGTGPLPTAATPPERSPLGWLLRVAAAVRGLLPADRRSFRLFAHLARALGWSNKELARALALSERRIRQLLADREPLLGVALVHVVDERLATVP